MNTKDLSTLQSLLDRVPNPVGPELTFLEIGGYAHLENISSNILRYYFTQMPFENEIHRCVLTSLLQCVGIERAPFDDFSSLNVRREVVTDSGRIDLVLSTKHWVIAIENKIFHSLHNDLAEYARYIKRSLGHRECVMLVLSIRPEIIDPATGFVNVTYSSLVRQIEANLDKLTLTLNRKTIFLQEFLQSLKNIYMPFHMPADQIKFLIENRDKIEQLYDLEANLAHHIKDRCYKLISNVSIPNGIEKSLYQDHDIVFERVDANIKYKLECVISKSGIRITICVEPNRIDTEALNRLRLFQEMGNKKFYNNEDNTRIVIDAIDDFFLDDDILVQKLNSILEDFKVVE